MSKYRKQDIETLLRLQLGEAEKAKINAQQAVERLERERTCAETYLPIIADKLQFSSSQFSKLSSGWCEELANAIADLQAQSKEACREAQQQVAQLREKVAHYDRWLAKGVYFTTEEYAERVKQFDTLHTAHTTLRGLVEALPVVNKPVVVCLNGNWTVKTTDWAPLYAYRFDKEQTARAFKALLEYRATLSHEGGAQESDEERKHKQWESDMFCDEKAGWEHSKMNPRNHS